MTEETTGIINADAFAKMRDGVVYLNTARAKIHDTDALVAALASGKVGAAGLDHFEGEHLATRPPADDVPPGRADAAHRRRHLRHRVQPHPHHRRGPVPPDGRGAAAAHRQPRGPRRLTWRRANRPSSPPPSGSSPTGPTPRTCARGRPTGWPPTWPARASTPASASSPPPSGDDSTRLAAAHNAFSKLGFVSSHLTLFPMPNVPDVRAHLLAQDVIWVGGGSTANLLALWRLHGLDVILRECWEAGVVLKGVSAGSLCWHVGGTTDSFGPTLRPVTNGLAFLPYSNSPHHDAEEQRRPLIHRLIAEGTLPDGYATENGTGLVFFGTELQ